MLTGATLSKNKSSIEQKLVEQIKIGSLYEHYSGKRYKVLMLGRSSEDTTLQVVYQGLYSCEEFGDNPIWIRPLSMFLETVTVDNKRAPRFKEVNP
jgi:hypothetical protein